MFSVEGCGRGVVCGEDLVGSVPGWGVRLVRSAPVGNLSNRIIGDNIYYIYVSRGGGGFLVEANMEGLARGECGPKLREALIPLIESLLREDPLLPFLVMVVEEKMLR